MQRNFKVDRQKTKKNPFKLYLSVILTPVPCIFNIYNSTNDCTIFVL